MKSYTYLFLLALAAMPLASLASEQSIPRGPHVLIILSDDIGYSDTEVMGSEIRTPNLKKLSEKGRIFTQFYNTARCCPSRASLLTGKYPHEVGVGHLIYATPHEGYSNHLRTDSKTIAEILKDNDYRTYMSGKWHLAPRSYDPVKDIQYWPTRRGFDKFYGTIAGSGSFWDPVTLCRQESKISPFNDPEYQPEQFYYTDAITDNALMFLDDHFRETPEQPFFLYMAYTAAHWPLHAPEESIEEYRGVYDEGYEAIHAKRISAMRELGLLDSVGKVAPPVGDWDDVRFKRAEASLMETYAAMITRMDEGIGRVLDWLQQKGESDNLFVIYLQDNGACAEDWFSDNLLPKGDIQPIPNDALQTRWGPPMQTRDGRPVRNDESVIAGPDDTYTGYKKSWANVSNAPFRWYKHYLHEGGISTPAILFYPPKIEAVKKWRDRLIDKPVHLIDILPTILDISLKSKAESIRESNKMPGFSLWPLVENSSDWVRPKPLFFEHESNRAVRDGKWKIVALENQPWELYDISVDRGEMNDLAQTMPNKVIELAEKWDAWAKASRVLPLGGWRDQNRNDSLRSDSTTMTLKQGQIVPETETPVFAGSGIRITTVVEKGPAKGVLATQGDNMSGWEISAKDGYLIFGVRRVRDLYTLKSVPLPSAPFSVCAELSFDGIASISINGLSVSSDYWGPFISNPPGDLTVGLAGSGILREQNISGFEGILGPMSVDVIDK